MPTYRVTLDNGEQQLVTTDTEVTDAGQLQSLIDQHRQDQPPATQGAAPAPETEKQWHISLTDPSTIAPVQEGGVQRTLQARTQRDTAPMPGEGATATDVPAPLQAVQGVGQGMVQAVDEGVMGIPNLVQAGGMAVATPLLEAFGYEPAPPEPGSTRATVLRTLQRPLETLMAGQEGFPKLDGAAQQIQDIVRQTAGIMITSRLASQLVPALQAIPLDDALIQSVAGTAGKRIGEQSDSPWGPVIGELTAALTAQLGKDGVVKVLTALTPAAQAKKALGTVLRQTDNNVLNEHIATATRLEQLVPGLKLTPFQAADTPELLAIQKTLESEHPELAQQLRLWRVENQKLLQQAFGAKMGEGGTDAATATATAIEGLRAPYQQKQQLYTAALAQKEAEITKAKADFQAAQGVLATSEGLGANAKQAAARRVQQAKQAVEVLNDQQLKLKWQMEQHKTKFEMDRAALLASAEKTAAGNLPTTPLSYTERIDNTIKVWRNLYERLFKDFRTEATRRSDLIDPQNLVKYSVTELETSLNAQKQKFLAEGLPVPSAFDDVEAILAQARRAQGGVSTPLMPPQQMLPGLATTPAADATTLSMQDLRNAGTRMFEDLQKTPYGTRQRTLLQEADKIVTEAMDTATANAGDPSILKRYEDFARFWAQGKTTFTRNEGEILLGAKYLPPGGRTGAVLPEEYYTLTHGQVLGKLWGNAPIAGAPERGAAKLALFETFANELNKSPEGLKAMEEYLTQDFYMKVVDKNTREFSPKAAATWLRDHEAQLAKIPTVQAKFATTQQQVAQIAKAEDASLKFVDELHAQRTEAVRAHVQARRGPLAQAREAERGVKETVASDIESAKVGVEAATQAVKDVTLTATERAQAAEKAMQEALAEWQAAFGKGPAASYAVEHTAATDALGGTPENLIAEVNKLDPNQRAFALGRLTEPIKNDPQAVTGLRDALWKDYVDKHVDKLADPQLNQLVKDLPLAKPELVMSWLKDYEGWFTRYSSVEHYNDLMTMARGMKMNSMAGAAAPETVPAALKAMTPTTRMLNKVAVALPVAGLEMLRGATGWGIGTAFGVGTVVGTFWNSLSNSQRLTFLREATFNADTAHLLNVMAQGKADPTWLRTALYHESTKLGLSVGARGSEIADVMNAPAPSPTP